MESSRNSTLWEVLGTASANASGAVTKINYIGQVIWNIVLLRSIPSITLGVQEKVTYRFNNISIFSITRVIWN